MVCQNFIDNLYTFLYISYLYWQHNQEALHSMATDTTRKLYESQQEMLGHHQQLQITQEGVMTQITDNMESLKTEKALIAAGNKELADRTQNIKQKLGIPTTVLIKPLIN